MRWPRQREGPWASGYVKLNKEAVEGGVRGRNLRMLLRAGMGGPSLPLDWLSNANMFVGRRS